MTIDIGEWLSLALRWFHLTAGIAWIGSSFYFVWLDNHLKKPASGDASGEVWSVHGGGFYHNQKYQVAPSQMPADLHWFKWEAYTTWISGFSLLVLIYFIGADTYLIDTAKARLSTSDAVAMALGVLLAGWVFYDLLCRSPLGRDERVVGIVWFGFLICAAIFLNSVFNARAAYILIGAMTGSVMVANVFFVIIPNQKVVVRDLTAGRTPNPVLGKQAKQRSLHNNYMTLPVLFIMISQHYPMTYGAERPWLVLALISLTAIAVRHSFNLRHKGKVPVPVYAIIIVLALGTITYVSIEKRDAPMEVAQQVAAATVGEGKFEAIQPVIARHCSSCHSLRPTNPAFTQPPLGLVLDSYDQVRAAAPKIKLLTVDTQTMPLGNETSMTISERKQLGDWINQGSPR